MIGEAGGLLVVVRAVAWALIASALRRLRLRRASLWAGRRSMRAMFPHAMAALEVEDEPKRRLPRPTGALCTLSIMAWFLPAMGIGSLLLAGLLLAAAAAN